jgi:hypothetical protein
VIKPRGLMQVFVLTLMTNFWTTEEVAGWLSSVGLEAIVPKFCGKNVHILTIMLCKQFATMEFNYKKVCWYSYFADELVDGACLSTISEEDIKLLIPVLGLRSRFWKAHRLLVSTFKING